MTSFPHDGPGSHDAGLEEAAKVRYVRRRAHAVFAAHGYRELMPAALEPPGQAARLGLDTLALTDGRELRGDAIAALARVYAAGPDAGRFARHMMAGALFDVAPTGKLAVPAYEVEAGALFGVAGPEGDADVAQLAHALAHDPGLHDAQLCLSTLGDDEDVTRYLATLEELVPLGCARCRASADRLAFFSCDQEGCRALAAAAPGPRDFVSPDALAHHAEVLSILTASGVYVRDEPRLAFGANRYRRTLIELRARLPNGSSIVVARGGRRDRLVALVGAPQTPPTPTVGLTLGLRHAAACITPADASFEPAVDIFFAARGPQARIWAFRAAAAERARGFRVDVHLEEHDDPLPRATALRARVIVLASDDAPDEVELHVADQAPRYLPAATLSSEIKRLLR